MSEISLDDGWDRTFLRWGSRCADPICWAYGQLRYRLVMPLDPTKFDNAGLALEQDIKLLNSELRPKRGDHSKAVNKDEFGAFYEFARTLVLEIVDRGGRATVDKNSGGGTLVTVLRLLRPYLPSDGIPPFVAEDGSVEGLHRLDRVRADALRNLKSHLVPTGQ